MISTYTWARLKIKNMGFSKQTEKSYLGYLKGMNENEIIKFTKRICK